VQAAVLAGFSADGVQQIQEAQVDGVDFVGAVIPQDRVHRFYGALIVVAVLAVADLQALAGMGIEKLEGPITPFIGPGSGI
jgi:hypothetical protein